MFTFLGWWRVPGTRDTVRPPRGARSRPGLEALEDRKLPTNILFVGNSYTDLSATDTDPPHQVMKAVRDIAAAAGQAVPNTSEYAPGGHLLIQSAQELTPAKLRSLVPPGQSIDFVVLQGQSLEAASRVPSQDIGTGLPADHVAEFLQGANGVAQDVRSVYPNAHVILYETDARNPLRTANPSVYPNDYPGPGEMQSDILNAYTTALNNLRGSYGSGAADLAPAGEAFRNLGFEDSLYLPVDTGGHPSNSGYLLAAMTIYSAVYDDSVSHIPASSAAALLQSRGLTAADWQSLTAAADRATGQVQAGQDRQFVQQVYSDQLGRSPDSGESDYWTGQLAAGAATRTQPVQKLIASDEYRLFFIRDQYQYVLGRAADPGGLIYFLGQLRAGATLDQVRDEFYSSDEFYRRSGGTNDGFVRNLYSTPSSSTGPPPTAR